MVRLICALLLLCAFPVAAGPALRGVHGNTMGTTWKVRWVAVDARRDDAIQRGIQVQLDRVDGQMSTYKPASELSRFNRAPAGSWQVISPEFFIVLQHALELARHSGGAYDPTIGPLVNLWGFGPDQRPRHAPVAAELAAARSRVGWQKLKLDAAAHKVFQPGGVYVDLSSVAKGFGVDQVARYLQRSGIENFLVEVGGELRGSGLKPDGKPWRVGIERPDAAAGEVMAEEELITAVELKDQALATSGDYRHVFEDQGRFYSHHIDPRTGYPVPHDIASVSVLASECMQADPLGTTLSVLGADRGMAFARKHHLAVLMIVRTPRGFEQRMSPAFARAIQP